MKKSIVFLLLINILFFSNILIAVDADKIKDYVPVIKDADIKEYIEDEGALRIVLTEEAKERFFQESVNYVRGEIFNNLLWESENIQDEFTKITDLIPEQYRISFMKDLYRSLKDQTAEVNDKVVSENKIVNAIDYVFERYHTPKNTMDKIKKKIELSVDKKKFSN